MRFNKLFTSSQRSHDQIYKLAEERCCYVLLLKVNSVKCLQDTVTMSSKRANHSWSISHTLILNRFILYGETPMCKIVWRKKDPHVLQDTHGHFTEGNLTPSLHLYLPSYHPQDQGEDTAAGQDNR